MSKLFLNALLLAICLGIFNGCIQIRQTIQLNQDGSGTITVITRFDDRLIRISQSSPEHKTFTEYLSRVNAEKNIKNFGAVELASHKIRNLGAKGQEAITVMTFKDINKVTIPALPHRGANWREQKIHFKLGKPTVYFLRHRGAYYHRMPLSISFSPKTIPAQAGKNPQSPVEMEKLRSMLPIVRSMMEGLHLSLTIKAFGNIGASKEHVIYYLTDNHLKDDETLTKLLIWNKYPDTHLGAKGRISGGSIMYRNYDVNINLSSAPTNLNPEISPADKKKPGQQKQKNE